MILIDFCGREFLIIYCFRTDGAFCSSYYLSDVLLDSEWSHSAESNETALNMAFKTSLPGFEWQGLPENEYRRKLFGIGMRGLQGNPDVVLDGACARSQVLVVHHLINDYSDRF